MMVLVLFVLFVLLIGWVVWGALGWGITWEATEDYLLSLREGLEEWEVLEAQFLSWGGEVSTPLLGHEYEYHARVIEEVRFSLENPSLLMGWEEEAVGLGCEYLRECLRGSEF